MEKFFFENLLWLTQNASKLKLINRGIERETLRVTDDFRLAPTKHPKALGAAFTHPSITTDFSENLLEFVTPVFTDIKKLTASLHDLHKFTYQYINNELLWPLSFPCFLNAEESIPIAEYGKSNQAKFKKTYRKGLKNRYGAMMQTIAGIHYNFSFPEDYWRAKKDSLTVSDHYLAMIRNYYRFGWLIPYLFGASPALCSSFVQNKNRISADKLNLKQAEKGFLYGEYSTSLRLSNLGYTSSLQEKMRVNFNDLDKYLTELRGATQLPVDDFIAIGIKDENGEYKQLNPNLLQIANEYYAPIRPKRVTEPGKSILDSLAAKGIEYLEIRSVDLNPFDPLGITEEQIKFMDLFLIWSELMPSPKFVDQEHRQHMQTWQKIVVNGRKADIVIPFYKKNIALKEFLTLFFNQIFKIAEIIDSEFVTNDYKDLCLKYTKVIEDSSIVLSQKVLDSVQIQGLKDFGLAQAKKFKQQLQESSYTIYTEQELQQLAKKSILDQQKIEEEQANQDFDSYLKQSLS